MFSIHSDKSKQLLTMSFSQQVEAEEMRNCVNETRSSLVGMQPGFCFLTNLTGLEHMDPSCAISIGEIMDQCAAAGVSAVSTVVPDPKKDIGFTLMYSFHYDEDISTMTHERLSEALDCLAA